MKRFLMATILACVLSGVALAGEIPIGGIAAPPPPAPSLTDTVILTIISIVIG